MKFLYRFLLIFLPAASLYGGGFDDLGNSARAVSMGGAFIGVADAPYTVFYNPAGINAINNLSISSTYSNLYPGISDDNIYYLAGSAVVPASFIGKFGVGATFLKTDLWQENMIVGTYARQIYKTFAVGGSIKLLRWSAEAAPGEDALSYLGFTFDVGAHYTFQNILEGSDIRIGASALNITEPSIASNGSDDAKLPMSLGVGLAFVSNQYNYIIAVDGIQYDGSLKIKAGAEFMGLRQEVFGARTEFLVRVGYDGIVDKSPYKQSGVNGGFGLNVEQLKIDYAYVFPLELQEVGGSHKISLSYNFKF